MAFTPRTDNLDDVMAVDVNEAYGLTLTNRSGGALVLGDVVIQDTTQDSSFTTTNVEANPKVIGVVAEGIANAASGVVMNGGPMAGVKCDAVAVTRGQYLITSTTLTQATSTSTWQTGVFAIALTAKGAGVGTVTAWLLGERPGSSLELRIAAGDPQIVFDIAGTDKFTVAVDDSDNDIFKINSGGSVADVSDLALTSGGTLFLSENANTKMTVGLTINQAGNDDEILALKSSDVGHAITTNYEADTYGAIKKAEADAGGLMIVGLKDGGGVAGHALHFRGILDEAAADTTKTTAAIGVVTIDGTLEGTNVAALCGADENLVVIRNLTTTRFIFDAEGTLHSTGATAIDQFGNGKWFLNDNANTKMTLGLTINQGANDNEIIALKSSDVGQPVTDLAEEDTFGSFSKESGAGGGLRIRGFTDTDAAAYGALGLYGTLGEAANTLKDTSGYGVVMLAAAITDGGTGQAVVGADGNLVSIMNLSTVRFIFDAEGSAHADVEWIAFGEEDDIALLTALESEFARRKDPIKAEFGAFLEEGRDILQREKVVNFYDDGPRAMVNFSRLAMLHTGSIRQNARRITEGLESVFAQLERYEQALLSIGVSPKLLQEAS